MSTPTRTTTVAPSSTQDVLTASCTTATPGKYGFVPIDACNSYYNYDPSFASAIAVAVLFGLLLVTHIVEAFAFKKPYCWVLIMGAVWETVSFILHAMGSHDQQNVGYASGAQLLYLLAPLWINAFVYMSFARAVYYFLPEKSVWHIKAAGLAKWFVIFDIISFIVQGIGGILASPGAGPSVIKTGINVYIAGMGLQQFYILCFAWLMYTFQKRATALEKTGESLRVRSWRPLLYALYGVLVCITVRIIYRISEFAGGIKPSNPVPFHEAYSYALDANPMMIALLILAILHPGRTLVGPESSFPRLSRKEKKAIKCEKKAAKKAKKEMKNDRTASKHLDPLVTETDELTTFAVDGPEQDRWDGGQNRNSHSRHRSRSRRGSSGYPVSPSRHHSRQRRGSSAYPDNLDSRPHSRPRRDHPGYP